jgi:hypothetical protein
MPGIGEEAQGASVNLYSTRVWSDVGGSFGRMWHEGMNADPVERTTKTRICFGLRQAVGDNLVDHNIWEQQARKEIGDTSRPSVSVKH